MLRAPALHSRRAGLAVSCGRPTSLGLTLRDPSPPETRALDRVADLVAGGGEARKLVVGAEDGVVQGGRTPGSPAYKPRASPESVSFITRSALFSKRKW
jgi:hypothetical protein